jgi:hypothetical protein
VVLSIVTRPPETDGVLSMPSWNRTGAEALPLDDLARVIEACERFEADCNAGRPRRIEKEIASQDEPIRSHLLRELLTLEFALSRRDGRSADLEAYLARFPDRPDTIREVFAMATLAASDLEPTDCVTKVPACKPSRWSSRASRCRLIASGRNSTGQCRGAPTCLASPGSFGVTMIRGFSPSCPRKPLAPGARASRGVAPARRPRSWRAGCAAGRASIP